jgi:hypothetical protein
VYDLRVCTLKTISSKIPQFSDPSTKGCKSVKMREVETADIHLETPRHVDIYMLLTFTHASEVDGFGELCPDRF